MTKKLSDYAQVAKLLKQKGKELELTLSAKSQSFAGGNSVDVYVSKGSDKAIEELKNFSKQFVYGKFDGMTDYYDITNWNENIPQTKYLFIQDERAMTILKGLNDKYWDYSYEINGKRIGWYEFVNQVKEVFPNDAWQKVLQTLVDNQGNLVPYGLKQTFKIQKKIEEVA
jgi:hypothetical protein